MVLAETNPSQSFRLLLTPGFSSLSLASVTEPLRVANYLSGTPLYCWRTVSSDGAAVIDGAGLRVAVDGSLREAPGCDALIVCGGTDTAVSADAESHALLRALAAADAMLCGIEGGTWLLADAGVFDGYQCAIRWARLAEFRDAYPAVAASNRLFSFDRGRGSCVGGTAVIDMTLNLIAEQHGQRLAADISEMLVRDGVRGEHDLQRLPRRRVLRGARPKLAEAVAIMEANLQEPLGLEDLARYVGTSQRQLARLFQQHFRCSPSRFYLTLRLLRAREMLRRTPMPIDQVALACGFASTSHFSTRYRDHFGVSPSEGRCGLREVRPIRRPALAPLPASAMPEDSALVATA